PSRPSVRAANRGMSAGGPTAACAARPFPPRVDLNKRIATSEAVEVDQSKVRLIINGVILLYLIGTSLWDGVVSPGEARASALMTCVRMAALQPTAWVLRGTGVNHFRRCVVVCLDLGAITLIMAVTGEIGVMLYSVYPWVVIGNGFRYGRWYLHYSQAVGLA